MAETRTQAFMWGVVTTLLAGVLVAVSRVGLLALSTETPQRRGSRFAAALCALGLGFIFGSAVAKAEARSTDGRSRS